MGPPSRNRREPFTALRSFSGLRSSETIELSGVVRDFRRAHPDFDVATVDETGHYAGNVALTLPDDDRPDFVGGGFKVVDATGQALVYVYARETKADADIAKVLTFDETRRIAAIHAR